MGDLACQATITRRENKKRESIEYWESLGISPGDIVEIDGTLTKDGTAIYLGRIDKDKPQGIAIGGALVDGRFGPHVILAYSPQIGDMYGYTRAGIKEKKWRLHKKATSE
jgi:hypothetical protein